MQEIENSSYIFGQFLVLKNFTTRAWVKFGFAVIYDLAAHKISVWITNPLAKRIIHIISV